jgi:hypothetical protein
MVWNETQHICSQLLVYCLCFSLTFQCHRTNKNSIFELLLRFMGLQGLSQISTQWVAGTGGGVAKPTKELMALQTEEVTFALTAAVNGHSSR